MARTLSWAMAGVLVLSGVTFGQGTSKETGEDRFLTRARQLTFEGARAGEGYFDREGKRLIFQSEREPENPFFQIYLLDLLTGDTSRVSPGYGKTTCAWLHPDGRHAIFASTHEDPAAREKQKAEFELRASGKERRYAWDYDDQYELYERDLDTSALVRLTRERGYDAEGSYSPNGEWIAFASNRHAFSRALSTEAQTAFERDPSLQMELYRMRRDGSGVERLTDAPGYDGGPFFSPDGSALCFRRFDETGAVAEIRTLDLKSRHEQPLTRLGVMSWAPIFHPSGEYLIFTTNVQGFANFELYLVDARGSSPPVRVTFTEGFDGLASFSPDGKQLTWTSNRNAAKQSQIYLADWNHDAALLALGRTPQASNEVAASEVPAPAAPRVDPSEVNAAQSGRQAEMESLGEIAPIDLIRHVDFLCRPELEGRMTGTAGERLATAYVAAYLESLGLEPAGDEGYFQEFEFTAGASLGQDNALEDEEAKLTLDRDWRPLAFSDSGSYEAAPVVFAGYGITAPAEGDQAEYDSFVHLDVKDQWVLVFRFMPENISPERRQHLARFSSLRYKAMAVRDRGARGLIVVSGPNAKVRSELVPLQFDGSLAGSGLPVLSVTNAVASRWFARAKLDLGKLQTELDGGEPQMGRPLEGVSLKATVDVEKVRQTGRNVLARLRAGKSTEATTNHPHADNAAVRQELIIGAHVDHLGRGSGGASLAREDERDQIHFGADDNASGIAAMLEIAQFLVAEKEAERLEGHRDVLFAAWSGEELGLIGSSHFTKQRLEQQKQNGNADRQTLHPEIAACLNLDMVGRLEKKLILQGIGSSSVWRSEIERRNAPVGLPITLHNDGYLPTDANAFYLRGVPILSAFTGTHSEYHTPRDTPDLLNYDAMADVARLMALVARSLVLAESAPDFIPPTQSAAERPRAFLRAYLGTIPDYAEGDKPGVLLSGVAKDGPAEKGGIRGGDLIVEVAGKKIANIYDYTYALEALKVGQEVKILVEREGKRVTLHVTPGSRE